MTGIPVIPTVRADTYLRIISLSIALYDYILTLPAEWRFYESQKSVFRLSVDCKLFIAIRYTSMAALVISNYGFFAMTFDAASCKRYYMLALIFKVLQSMVSQLILGLRTYNISGRKKWVKWFMLTMYITFVSMEWFINLYQRYPVISATSQGQSTGNCGSRTNKLPFFAWLYYLLSMFYDLACLSISTVFLLTVDTRNRRLTRILRIIFYDGIGYLITLSAMNVINIILYKPSNITFQAAGTSLWYTVTWICSQRLLTHIREIALENQSYITVSQSPRSPKVISRALQSPFKSSNMYSQQDYPPPLTELDVHVHVEHTISVQHDDQSGACAREEQWKPQSTWDSKA